MLGASPFATGGGDPPSAHELSEHDAKFYPHMRGLPLTSSGSMMPMQLGQAKPGGITAGFPVQRSTTAPTPSVSSAGKGPPTPYSRFY